MCTCLRVSFNKVITTRAERMNSKGSIRDGGIPISVCEGVQVGWGAHADSCPTLIIEVHMVPFLRMNVPILICGNIQLVNFYIYLFTVFYLSPLSQETDRERKVKRNITGEMRREKEGR